MKENGLLPVSQVLPLDPVTVSLDTLPAHEKEDSGLLNELIVYRSESYIFCTCAWVWCASSELSS